MKVAYTVASAIMFGIAFSLTWMDFVVINLSCSAIEKIPLDVARLKQDCILASSCLGLGIILAFSALDEMIRKRK